ncbi:hypothetical protein QFZ22_009327 [Streptomyces canus]|uniref:Uncharacterized protein n=1 Tax=Streptomyces canus TaxID=58343 RepID=A0AAW8FWE5_9ACTN|nr:hypothetical protein [Streptomyces canus]MDQ0913342.1 hypothetical protein [Streptomyces canus]
MRGAQQHGRRHLPTLLERLAAGELRTAHLATRRTAVCAVVRPGG